MKILLCGAGQVTQELLRRLGETWTVTLNDIDSTKLTQVMTRFPVVTRIVPGDASSPVLLEKAGLPGHAFVLALTGDDDVNLAVARRAQEQGVKHILALVNRQANGPAFQELGVRALSVSLLPARTIFHYLQDPRLRVTTLGDGRGEIIEVEVAAHSWVVGKPVSLFSERSWRIVGILRGERLENPFPDTLIQAGDTLVILGEPPLYDPVCTLLECAMPSFPLGYGSSQLLALPDREACDKESLLAEGLFWAQNAKATRTHIFSEKGQCDLAAWLNRWGTAIDVTSQCVDHDLMGRLRDICLEKRVGLVIAPLLEASFFQALTKPTLISLAHSLPCPLLVAKGSHPYRRILVPYRDTPPLRSCPGNGHGHRPADGGHGRRGGGARAGFHQWRWRGRGRATAAGAGARVCLVPEMHPDRAYTRRQSRARDLGAVQGIRPARGGHFAQGEGALFPQRGRTHHRARAHLRACGHGVTREAADDARSS